MSEKKNYKVTSAYILRQVTKGVSSDTIYMNYFENDDYFNYTGKTDVPIFKSERLNELAPIVRKIKPRYIDYDQYMLAMSTRVEFLEELRKTYWSIYDAKMFDKVIWPTIRETSTIIKHIPELEGFEKYTRDLFDKLKKEPIFKDRKNKKKERITSESLNKEVGARQIAWNKLLGAIPMTKNDLLPDSMVQRVKNDFIDYVLDENPHYNIPDDFRDLVEAVTGYRYKAPKHPNKEARPDNSEFFYTQDFIDELNKGDILSAMRKRTVDNERCREDFGLKSDYYGGRNIEKYFGCSTRSVGQITDDYDDDDDTLSLTEMMECWDRAESYEYDDDDEIIQDADNKLMNTRATTKGDLRDEIVTNLFTKTHISKKFRPESIDSNIYRFKVDSEDLTDADEDSTERIRKKLNKNREVARERRVEKKRNKRIEKLNKKKKDVTDMMTELMTDGGFDDCIDFAMEMLNPSKKEEPVSASDGRFD